MIMIFLKLHLRCTPVLLELQIPLSGYKLGLDGLTFYLFCFFIILVYQKEA